MRTSPHFLLHILHSFREVIPNCFGHLPTHWHWLLSAWPDQVMQFLPAPVSSSTKWGYWSTCSYDPKICRENECHDVGDDTVNCEVKSKCYPYGDCCYCHLFYRTVIIWLAMRIFMTDKIWLILLLSVPNLQTILSIIMIYFLKLFGQL